MKRFQEALDRRIRDLERTSLGFSRVRLSTFLIGVVTTVVAFRTVDSGSEWLVLSAWVVAFVTLMRRHERVARSLQRHRVYRRIKTTHLARMDRDWDGLPAAQPDFTPESHPFAKDLDVLGPRSLHHLIDGSFSQGGSRRLADWLTNTDPDPAESEKRQRLVRDLRPHTALQDRIALLSAVLGGQGGDRFDGEVLLEWLNRHTDSERVLPLLRTLSALALLTAVLVALHAAGVLGAWWGASLTVYVVVYLYNGGLYSDLFDEAEHLHDQLERFRPVVERLERYHFPPETPLAELTGPFRNPTDRPSRHLKRVMWLAVAASAQKSEVLRVVLNAVGPWDLYFTHRLAQSKSSLRDVLPGWLDAVYTLEAAGSLASFSVLNPDAAFPEFSTEHTFNAEALSHPLLPRDAAVRNTATIDRSGRVLLITGSNMSGKSTFLRSLGLCQVLARAGGPVDATSCQTAAFRLNTSMGVHDSVTDGISFFYAEVKRLGALLRSVEAPSEYPALVLIDEIFRGTNNRERLEGSRSLLERLVRLPTIALVATHDLDLVKLAEKGKEFSNHHFREDVEAGRMIFDYVLRPGPCPTTNALRIMALEGLPVPEAAKA